MMRFDPSRQSCSSCTSTVAVAVVAAALLLTLPLASQSFPLGELFLHTPAATGLGPTDGAILRIDPRTGSTSIFVDLDGTEQDNGAIAYDPFRDRLLFSGVLAGGSPPKVLWAADAAGNTQSLGFAGQSFHQLAPTGDGRVYYQAWPSQLGEVSYLDAANQTRRLMDESGSSPFRFPGSPFLYSVMVYHAPTAALIVAGISLQTGCAGGGPANAIVVRRAALSPDGSRVVGPVLCNQFDVSTVAASEVPVGISVMDDGDVLLVVKTSAPVLVEPRLVRVKPESLALSAFASNGLSNGRALWTDAGTYSSALGAAVTLDSANDTLRVFADGSSGPGSVLATTLPVSYSGSVGEIATLIQIRELPCAGSFATYGTGLAGNGGFVPALTGTGCPVPGNTIRLHASSANGAAVGALLLGATPSSVPFLGGTLLVNPIASVTIATSGAVGVAGAGHASLPLSIDNGLSGVVVYFQCACLDAATPFGLSFSGGLMVRIG